MFDAQVQLRNGSCQLRYEWAQTLIGSMMSEGVRRFFPAIISLLTFLGFLPTLWNGFIDWQDAANLIDNANYRGFGWANIVWAFKTLQSGYYQPLPWLSFAIDYRLWNLDPFGFHLTSVLIHSANAALLYLVAVQLLSSTEPQQSELTMLAVRWAAAGAVLLFSLHPMRVEAVAWASARNLLLTTFFILLALSGYLLAVQSRANNPAYRKWMCLSIAAHLLSILCGANGLALPVLLLFLDICTLRWLELRSSARCWPKLANALLEKLPFVALGIVGITTVLTLRSESPASIDLANTARLEWLAQMFYEPVFYLWKTLVPSRLLPAYDLPEVSSTWEWFFFLGGFVLITFAVGVSLVRRRRISLVWLCYLTMVFTPRIQSGVDGVQALADRYSYLPSLVLAVVVAAALRYLLRSLSQGRIRLSTFAAGSGGILFVLMFLGIQTWRQSSIWHDGEKLWRHAVAVDPRSRQARRKLADLLVTKDRDGEAIQLYRQAARDNPDSALAQVDLAQLLVARGQLDEAHSSYRRALDINANLPQGLFGMGNLLAMRGDLDGAILLYYRALDGAPSASFIHVNLGYALARRGQLDEATSHYRRALQMDSSNVNAYFNLAGILATQGRVEDAVRNYRAALKIVPSHAKAHYGLANLLIKIGNRKEAMDHLREAIKFEPDQAEPYFNLGIILADQGQLDSAIAYYRHALGLKPSFAEARLNLARALAAQGKKQEALHEYQEARRLLQAGNISTGTR